MVPVALSAERVAQSEETADLSDLPELPLQVPVLASTTKVLYLVPAKNCCPVLHPDQDSPQVLLWQQSCESDKPLWVVNLSGRTASLYEDSKVLKSYLIPNR